MANDETFGEFIGRHREKKGLTQLELGKIMGVSQAAIGQWERNTFIPRSKKTIKLAEVLEVSYEEIKQLADLAKKNLSNNKLISRKNERIKTDFENMSFDSEGMMVLAKLANALGKNLLKSEQIDMINSLIQTFQRDNIR